MLEQAKLESQQSSAASQHSEEVRRSAFCFCFCFFCFLFFLFFPCVFAVVSISFQFGKQMCSQSAFRSGKKKRFPCFLIFFLLVCMLLFVLIFSLENCIIFCVCFAVLCTSIQFGRIDVQPVSVLKRQEDALFCGFFWYFFACVSAVVFISFQFGKQMCLETSWAFVY